MPTIHELHRNVFTGQRFDTNGLQGIADGSVWSIDGPATVNNSSSTAYSIATKSTWSTLVVQNTYETEASDDTVDIGAAMGIALKGRNSIGGIAHITANSSVGRTSIISSTDGGTTNRESLTVSPEGYIGIGHTAPTVALNTKGTLDTNFPGTVTTTGGKVTSVTIEDGGSGYTINSSTLSCVKNGTTTVTTASTSSLEIGMSITGTGIPSSTVVVTIVNATSFTISAAATDSATSTLSFYLRDDLTVVNTGSGGTGFAGTYTVVGGGAGPAAIATITITNAGSGYTSPPAVTGNGSSEDATLTAVIDSVVTIPTFTLSCTKNISTNIITYPSPPQPLVIGTLVSGTAIPTGATIATIPSSTTFTLSSNATNNGTSTLTFSPPHGIRAGDAVSLDTGAGSDLENFTVSAVANTTQFLVDSHPTTHITGSAAASNKMDTDFIKIESGDGNSLLIIDKTGHIGIGGAPRVALDVGLQTDAIILPTGTANQAPGASASQIGSAIGGMVRFDSTSGAFKGYDGSAWIILGLQGIQDEDGDTKISPEVNSDEDKLTFYTDGTIRMIIEETGEFTFPDGSFRVGADTDGYDVKMFGDTTGKYWLWDESADKMIVSGAADITGDLNVSGDTYTDIIRRKSDNSTTTKIRFPSGNDVQIHAGHSSNPVLRVQSGVVTVDGEITVTTLDIGGTNVTSTAAELNILDGVTTTAAELNLIDGGTARGTDAIADGDGVLINDAGTMKMTTVQTLAAYLDDEITSMPNLTTAASLTTTAATTVGALNTGSITSGFTSIDVGAGAITTTGTISAGTLDVADAGIAIIPNSTSYNNQTTNGEIELVKTGGNGYIYFHVGDTKYRVQGSAV